MAGPITWRTINAPSVSEASRPLMAAEQSINSGFDRLAGLVRDREAVNQGVVDRADEASVQGFLDRIQGAQTPEQVAAMQASGELNTLRASISPKNLSRVRGAEDSRVAGLMKQISDRATFADQQLDREQAPIRDQIMGFVANGETDRALSALAENPKLRNSSVVFQAIKNGERDLTKFGWERDKQAWAAQDAAAREALRPLEFQSKQASINASNAAVAAAEENRILAADQRLAAKTAAKIAAEAAALGDAGNAFVSDGVFNPNDTEALTKLMVDNGIGDDSDARAAILKRIGTMSEGTVEVRGADGKMIKRSVPIPLSMVKQAILGSSGGYFWNTDNDWADSAEENLNAAIARTRKVRLGDGTEVEQNNLAADFAAWAKNRQDAVNNPAPASSKKK